MKHVVGGIALQIEGDCPPDAGALAPEAPDITLHLAAVSSPAPLRPPGAPALERASWRGFLDGDTVVLCIAGAGDPPEAMRFELPRRSLQGRLYFRDDVPPRPFCYPTDQLLVIHALGVAGGFLAHAAGIAGRDGAFLVAGPSGAGKTTMSRFAAPLGARILSDERTIVRPRPGADGQWLLGGTPWPGEGGFAHNSSVPLRGLILLEQADRDELVPLSPARALARLYGCHFPPLWDPDAAERTLDHLQRLVGDVPAFVFRNRKGPDAARLLLDRLGGPP
jgi:hypothetical protein